MCSGSEEGSYLRLIDFVYHSTLDLSVIKKKEKVPQTWRPEHSPKLRLIDSCITQLTAQGPSRTCNESQAEEEDDTADVAAGALSEVEAVKRLDDERYVALQQKSACLLT